LSGLGLSRFGGHVHGHGNGSLQVSLDLLVDWLRRFDINGGDEQVVVGETNHGVELILVLRFLVSTEDTSLDDVLGVFLEIFKGLTRDGTSDSRSDVLTAVSNEIANAEKFVNLIIVGSIDLEVPVVTELEREFGVIGSFNLDDISHEIWTELHGKGLDLTFDFWCSTRELDESELLVWFEEDETWAENDLFFTGLVIVQLNS